MISFDYLQKLPHVKYFDPETIPVFQSRVRFQSGASCFRIVVRHVSGGTTWYGSTAVGFDWLFAIKIATIGSFCNQNCHHALKIAIKIASMP